MAELTVPQIDFSSLGRLPQAYQQAQANQLRAQTLAELGQGDGPLDYNAAARKLLAAGDREGAMSLATLGATNEQRQYQRGRDATTDARQATNDTFSHNLQTQSLDLQKRAADRADEDKFSVQKVEDPNTGATSFVKVNPRTGEVVPTGPQVAPSTPNNPFSSGGKFNGDQGKAAGFTDRMLQSEGILSGVGPTPGQEGPPMPGVQGQGADITQTAMSKIPGAGNFMVSGDRQKYNQAKADFINSQLRRESGAAIAKSEFDNADKQYFPVPGDSAAVIQQKAANRRAAIEAMGREGGGSYKPKLSFDEGGGVVPYGAPARAALPPDGLSGTSVVASSAPQDPRFPPPPKLGELRGGYRFKGGNPGEPSNWVKASN